MVCNSCSIPRSWNKTLQAQKRKRPIDATEGTRMKVDGRECCYRNVESAIEMALSLRKHRCCIYVKNISTINVHPWDTSVCRGG